MLPLVALVFALVALDDQPRYPMPATQAETGFGHGVQRTMGLLATSTPERRHKVKILFYGQSITQQSWTKLVAEDLRKRFPNADLTLENRAIGGFSAPVLIRTAEADVYPFYPDLIIFHVYGGDPDYEALQAEIRRRTAAEVLFHSDHVTWLPGEGDEANQLKGYNWHDSHSTKFLPELAARLGAECAEIRTPWKRYLADNHLKPRALLSDSVHLNDHGNFLMAELVKRHLRYDPSLPGDRGASLARTYEVGRDALWKDGSLTLDFEGNRVDLIASTGPGGGPPATILIDGKAPSTLPGVYAPTRVSPVPGIDWPAILRVSADAPPIAEDWTATITKIDADMKNFTFDVAGTVTGPDGSGAGDKPFRSTSGRVVIDPKDWWVEPTFRIQHKPTPVGTVYRWRVVPMFADAYTAPPAMDARREVSTTVAQGYANGRHTLKIAVGVGDRPAIRAVRVYRPPVSSTGEQP